jgi:urea carboxylase
MFRSVLIANRGAIATRILRTLRQRGIQSIAVYHAADAESLHVQQADKAILLGDGTAADTYLNIDKIIDAAKKTGADAIHPGYGFLSENAHFVARCEQEGIVFIGPTQAQITLFGLKHQAREIAARTNVPMIPGSGLLHDIESACTWARQIGYPVMLKSTAGGGGIGMQACHDEQQLCDAWASVKRLGANFFSNDGVFLEKYILNARHIEVQIFGDGHGNVISLGERDCSAQRRNQKVIEETPAPHLTQALREQLWQTAEKLTASVNYRNAGTVEFIYDVDAQQFYFLEVNTRLQVEHGVTEAVWGLDLVDWMLQLAAGSLPPLNDLKNSLSPKGHAIQVRLYAENPQQHFLPSAGLLAAVALSADCCNTDNTVRIDTWIESGIEVSPLFDPMLAKIICTGKDRQSALNQLQHSLNHSTLYGLETNLPYVSAILASPSCQKGLLLTRTLANFSIQIPSITVLQAGTQTTLQDYPGRTGYWHVGVPPSGAMDRVSFQLANRLLDNAENCSGLEITLTGPKLKFNCATRIVLTGAPCDIQLLDDNNANPKHLERFRVYSVTSGQILTIGNIAAAGARVYLAVDNGFHCPAYLGSQSTFTLGQFGGHNGRALATGDVLHVNVPSPQCALPMPETVACPPWNDEWELRVVYGPHGQPDFFTDEDIRQFFSHTWEVHYNSSRTGVRLIGPKPQWARTTGGEAGLHPSNIHDNAYAFGAIDFTGDMPVILGPDGPSLGGFVCPATVITADLWKLGQLKSGSKIRFVPITLAQAVDAEADQIRGIAACDGRVLAPQSATAAVSPLPSPILHITEFDQEPLVFRVAGDHFLLIELGPLELDIERRFKIHALMLWIQNHLLPGIYELTPGIRSLQVHYNSQQLSARDVIAHIERGATTLALDKNLSIPSRIVYLPLSWDDEACQLAIQKYTQSVRPGAPWCPSNLEFIRRINGLPSISAVKDIVFNASYLVMGLGDVYLGAPVATPLDPRHRLVTTKYNPARTWTAENSVGIGGAYLCVYGMEGPGGYQFVGRTVQMWNRYRRTQAFDKPWLLAFFDQIRFYAVTASELSAIRQQFPLGKYPLKIETTLFNLHDYRESLTSHRDEIAQFEIQRQTAFATELANWHATDQFEFKTLEAEPVMEGHDWPEDAIGVESPAAGSVWQLLVTEGQTVNKGDRLLIMESMKMEIPLYATEAGTITQIFVVAGSQVKSGQTLILIQ